MPTVISDNYLEALIEVFADCARALDEGGRQLTQLKLRTTALRVYRTKVVFRSRSTTP